MTDIASLTPATFEEIMTLGNRGFQKWNVQEYVIEATALQRRPKQNVHAKGRPSAARPRPMFRDPTRAAFGRPPFKNV